MFYRLHTASSTKPLVKTKSSFKTDLKPSPLKPKNKNSYAKAFSKKKTRSLELELLRSSAYLFQGYHLNFCKEGEGILLGRDGMLIIGSWLRDRLHGRAMIFSSFGGRIFANFNDGKLNGWVVAKCGRNIIICKKYYQNKIDSDKLIFEESEELWVSSKHTDDDKLICITHVEKGTARKLPSFSSSEELRDIFHRYIVLGDSFIEAETIQCKSLSPRLKYIGFLDEEDKPFGLGITFSDDEYFFGNYFDGALEHYGRILFSNGQVYHGELSNGLFSGEGFYYKPSINQSTVMRTEDGQQKVRAEMDGYALIDIQPTLGGDCSNTETGIEGTALRVLCANIEKYYMREFVNTTPKTESKSPNMEPSGISEDFEKQDQISLHGQASLSKKERWLNLEGSEFDFKRVGSSSPRRHLRDENYETTEVKENSNSEEVESYKKAYPQMSVVREGAFRQEEKTEKKSSSLTAGEITFRNREEEKSKAPQQEESIRQRHSGKVEAILSKVAANRRRIF